MALKRSRATLEAELQAKQSPFVKYGTPLPPIDPDIRDDGSFVPVWQQEVRDDKGRRRLHGAFTGGFSAGYFNTVGSKEGWAPSTFVSSRSKKREAQEQQRVEDFMDEDDLAEMNASQKLGTSEDFSGLGSTATDGKRLAGMMDILRPQGDTKGVRLLQKMGWRHGQGIGARVHRKARTDGAEDQSQSDEKLHLFAPEDTRMIQFINKKDTKGLGYSSAGQAVSSTTSSKLKPRPAARLIEFSRLQHDDDNEDDDTHMPMFAVKRKNGNTKKQAPPRRTGIGTGINDESDEEDAYDAGPKTSCNRTVGDDSESADAPAVIKPRRSLANPLIQNKPHLIRSKQLNKGTSLQKCRDGRLPLDGFELADALDASLSFNDLKEKYPLPKAPPDWQSSKSSSTPTVDASKYTTAAEAARASHLDPQARSQLLGEERLQGQSVFDFLTPEARDRLAKATGRTDLPPALSQPLPSTLKPAHAASTELAEVDIPELDSATATAALSRGSSGWMPYAEDEVKRARYVAFLEFRAGIRSTPPNRPLQLGKDTWLAELREFAHAARVFKPVSGLMASRFTSAKASAPSSADAAKPMLDVPSERKRDDPAEEAARLGMFGVMTRSTERFYPTRLVCKRFNVPPPVHSDFSEEASTAAAGSASRAGAAPDLVSKQTMEGLMREAATSNFGRGGVAVDATVAGNTAVEHQSQPQAGFFGQAEVNAERNEALESQRAGEAVFKAIFGSDDEDE